MSKNLREPYLSGKRLKITGYILELSYYDRWRVLEKTYGHKHYEDEDILYEPVKPTSEEIKEKSLRRAKKTIIDLLNCNAYQWKDRKGNPHKPILITFTFRDNITDLSFANKEFTKFIRKFSYEILGWKASFLKYIAIVEFQKRGAIHYHVVFFNLPFVERLYDKLAELWTWGFCQVEAIYNVRKIGLYLGKYLTKNLTGDKLEKNRKAYFPSRGLKRPIIISYDEIVSLIEKILPEDTKTNKEPIKFTADFLGEVVRNYYDLKNYPEILEQIQKEFIDKYL